MPVCPSFILRLLFARTGTRNPERAVPQILSAITTPLPGDNPLGRDINYDPAFDKLKSEIGKLGEIDYDAVESTAISLLREKSKDLRVMSFLGLAYLKNDKWEHLADVFDAMAQLAEQSYEGLFPLRPRAKQNALKWLSESRFADMVGAKAPADADHEHVVRLKAALDRLKPVLDKHFPEGAPFPSRLSSAAQKWASATKPKPEGPSQNAGTSTSLQQTADPMDTPKQALATVRKAALFLIDKEPTKPMGYRLLRSARWDMLDKAPPSDAGKTRLAPPNAEQRAYLQKLTANGDWQALLPAAQKAFGAGSNHFWLDLQRVSAMACQSMAGYEQVQHAIEAEAGLLLKRVPEMQDLAFSDGTPFCDPATRDWIASLVSKPSSGDETQVKTSVREQDSIDEERKEINALVAQGKVEQALDLLQKRISESSSERDNFRRSMTLGSLLLSNKRPDIALAVLEGLDEKIASYHLDRWDPPLAVEAWALLIRACKAGASGKPQNVQTAMLEKQNTILRKLSRTDPKSAFSIQT
ncbi:MAG: type VI secretion system protein TssA [Chitinivibrionales bacterium]|nr:type VI secretion system protein TssA [Chitinivibrionales bacterium]MBD3394613.1 type VI secretion system protein TssA [Chitinivibrionales bacterium]